MILGDRRGGRWSAHVASWPSDSAAAWCGVDVQLYGEAVVGAGGHVGCSYRIWDLWISNDCEWSGARVRIRIRITIKTILRRSLSPDTPPIPLSLSAIPLPARPYFIPFCTPTKAGSSPSIPPHIPPMSLRSPASPSSSHRRLYFPDHSSSSSSSSSPHTCLSPLPLEHEQVADFPYPYPWNRVHSRSRPASLRASRGRSRASSISSIVSVCSDQSDDQDQDDDAASIFSDAECTSTHTSCSSAREEMDEGKRMALATVAVVPTSTGKFTSSESSPRTRPRGPRPLPRIPTVSAPAPPSTKPRILISTDTDCCIPYVQRCEDDPYSATHTPVSPGARFMSSDTDSPISPTRGNGKPRVRFADTLMRSEDMEVSPLDLLFKGVPEDDVIDWERIEEFMHAWDGYGLTGGREVRVAQACHG